MRLSPYHVVVPAHPREGLCLLYSTLNGSAVCIAEERYHRLAQGIPARKVAELPARLAQVLQKHFLVDDMGAHRRDVRQRIEHSVVSSKRFALTALTTARCNFGCSYCYQNGVLDRGRDMSPATASQVLGWLEQTVEAAQPGNFELHLYGGEPLLNPVALWALLDGAREVCADLSVPFGAYITTNGYLLTQRTAARLAAGGLRTALVSLDGPPEVHDRRRPLASGHGTFHRILSNIESVARVLRICVRINIDKQNADAVPELLDLLAERGLQERILIDLEVISPILVASPHTEQFLFREEDDLRAIEHLWEACAERGFGVFGAMPIEGACEHKSIHTYTVAPDGELYECPGFVGVSGFRIGHVSNGVKPRQARSGLVNRPWSACSDCPYLPICQGGCRMCNYVTKGEVKSRYCKRSFFERAYPSFLRAKYARRLRAVTEGPDSEG